MHKEITINTPFDKDVAEKQMRPGNNTIKGSALLRQQGGTVVTCAGNGVRLTPYSNYARERMVALYLDDNGGINQIILDVPTPFTSKEAPARGITPPIADGYLETGKVTQCDAQGYFSFTDLADGYYYITTSVIWGASPRTQGGFMMKKVHVEGGETKEIVINGRP